MTRSLKMAAVLAAAILAGWPGGAVADAQSPCTDMGGAVDNTTCHIHATTDTYTFDATFPVDYAEMQPMIDYLTQTRDGFINVSQMPGSRNLPYELDVSGTEYRSGTAPHGTQSAVFKIFQDVGGAHPVTWYKAFDYNLDSAQPITFDTLFKPASKPLTVIFPIVQSQLARQTGQPSLISQGEGMDSSHYQNFAITDNELIFFFSQGELLPSVAGANVVHVPRSAVAGVLA
ncbi:MAG: hypothetical protein QOE41_3333 [Mycobacterium sp.]|jgi:hypothetical protein|nr:hypothetical protein [Mycobacterium sp.]MDT5134022.1 hypothetical protein [Mycobacterium sp.]